MTDTTTTIPTADTLSAILDVARRSGDLDRTIASVPFADRESHVAFVRIWRSRLAELVSEIRALKVACKGPGYHGREQALREYRRRDARAMMLVRQAAKAVARREKTLAAAA